jgi:hypothetical protein
MQAWATVATTKGWVVALKSGVLAKDMFGLRITGCPFLTKREMPPIASNAFLVAATGSPEITARSYSSVACKKGGFPERANVAPAIAVFKNVRRVTIWLRLITIIPSPYYFSSLKKVI